MVHKHLIAIAGLVGAAAATVSQPVSATQITTTLGFKIGNFLDGLGNVAPPLKTLSGSFSVTFDPRFSYSTTTTGLSVLSSSYPAIGSPYSFA